MFNAISALGKFVLVSCFVVAMTAHVFAGDSQAISRKKSVAQMTNPASENCVMHGGRLEIRKHADGGEYGVCLFDAGKECEEWAMFYGDCPVGGIRISGYVTQAARYCAIRGGKYCSDTGQVESIYTDPFAYCAAIETIDVPGRPYKGSKAPHSIVKAMVRQGIVSKSAPPEVSQNVLWRCMGRKVWVCHFGANIPCTDKVDTSTVPTSVMSDYCRENPGSATIPAYATGRATAYEWRCHDGKPEIAGKLFTIDQQGYPTAFWHELIAQ